MTKEKMKYKGFEGSIDYSEEDAVFYGKIEDISDLVNYESETKSGLHKAFEESVDYYLAFCQEHNKQTTRMKSS